ncbi:hypothetical protein J2S53_003077 [Actinopolyspora lacussalsi]|nr:hypothetical protein [Actinopolyspora lacussalsi]
MIRRSRRSLSATLAALVLLAAAVLVSIASIQHLSGHPPIVSTTTLAADVLGRTWDDPIVVTTGVLAVLLGLILLVAGLLPGKPTVLPLANDPAGTGAEHTDAGVSRRTLGKDLTTTAAAADGVSSAALTVGRRRITATVRTPGADTREIGEQVRALLTDRLAEIVPVRTPTVRVKVTADRRSR